jgi:hypothetical protein
MNFRLVLFLLLLISIPFFYAFAFAAPNIQLDRTSDIQVDTDKNSVLTLTPNPNYDIITATPDLTITPANVGASSMNENAVLTLGNINSPSTNEAFTIQNIIGEQVTLQIQLQAQPSYTGSNADVVYYIETPSTGVEQIQVGDTLTVTLSAGQQMPVAVQIDSTGQTGDLSTTVSISGETQ